MDKRTASFDELVDLEWPINLRRVNKKPFLFYIAGKVPLSVSNLVSECSQNEDQVTKVLARRFESEIQTGQAGFLTLTDAARSPVVSYGKQFISQAKDEGNQAAELRSDEQIEAACHRYYHAAMLLAGVRERFVAVNYVPDQLNVLVERLEENADSLRKKHAKDVFKHQNLISKQREEEGDEAIQEDEYAVAKTKFREARDTLQKALDEVSAYNEQRLSAESPRLRTDSLEDRIEALQRKYDWTKEKRTSEPPERSRLESATQKETGDATPSTDSDSAEASKQALLDAIEDLARRLEKAPTTTEMKEKGRFEPHQYYDAFGRWVEALDQTDLNIQADLVSDLRRVADDLDKRPTQSDLDAHGRYDGHWYNQYFESWEDALDAAGLEGPSDEELIAEIKRLDRENVRIPSHNLMRDEGKYSPRLVRDAFGSWGAAIEDAGIDKRQRLIDELKRVNAECDGRTTTTVANDLSIYSPTYFSNEFGSWGDALEAAGITSDRSSDRTSVTTGSDPSQETGREIINPNKLAELYESLRVLKKVLIEYIKATPNLHPGADEPVADWQSAIEDVAVGDGINADVPCLGQLHADQNPFSMSEYREQYGDGDRVTDFQALAVAELGTQEYGRLVEVADSSLPRPRLPIVPGTSEQLPTLLSNRSDLNQALTLLEKLLTAIMDVDTVAPPALSATQADTDSTTISTQPTSIGTASDPDPLTLANIEPDETFEGPLVGYLTGYIASPSGEATSQLHFEDIAGDDFWLYITDHDVDYEWEKGKWYFISQLRGPKHLGGGRGDQALRSTPQLSVEDHGTSLPPMIDADVASSADSRTQSPPSTQTSSTTTSSDGQKSTPHRRDLLLSLTELAQTIGDLPNAEQIDERTQYPLKQYQNEFEDLFEAYKLAGMIPGNATRADFDDDISFDLYLSDDSRQETTITAKSESSKEHNDDSSQIGIDDKLKKKQLFGGDELL